MEIQTYSKKFEANDEELKRILAISIEFRTNQSNLGEFQ